MVVEVALLLVGALVAAGLVVAGGAVLFLKAVEEDTPAPPGLRSGGAGVHKSPARMPDPR